MLYYNDIIGINNYADFKTMFGKESNGRRRNKIFLALLKDKIAFHDAIHAQTLWPGLGARYNWLRVCRCLADVKVMIWQALDTRNGVPRGYDWKLAGYNFRCAEVEMDEYGGICEDGSINYIRYINKDGKVYKMKDGKFMRKVLEQNLITQSLPEQCKVWFCEEFCTEWRSYVKEHMNNDIRLFVDDDFKIIYNPCVCRGDFGSCMVDEGQYVFYTDCVNAKAAYLARIDEDGDIDTILARCVVFTEVTDADTGETLRLAERQYSRDGELVLKRQLINALIKGGYIDGYKSYSAGCGDAQAFVANDGSDWSSRRFEIRCTLDRNDVCSYQDSFKSYDMWSNVATNYGVGDIDLATTDPYPCKNILYSEYLDRYIPDNKAYYMEHRDDYALYDDVCTTVDGDYEAEEDCVYIDGYGWVYGDYISYCDHCGYPYDNRADGIYSDLTEEFYCCAECLTEEEARYAEKHGYVRDEDGEWVREEETEMVCA